MAGSRARDVARRAIGALTVTALLGAAVAFATGLAVPGAAAPPEARTPDRAGPSVVRTISPAPTIVTPTTVEPEDRPGITLTARPDADGSFLVREVIVLDVAATEVVLQPPSVGGAGAGFESRRPAATAVEVRAGGQPVPVPEGTVRGPTTLRWETPTDRLELRYRLTDVSVTSAPARPRRAVAAFGPLLTRVPTDLPVTVEVTGPTVLSLTCPQLPLAEMACAAGGTPKFWTLHPVPYERSRVLVQYDRPTQRG